VLAAAALRCIGGQMQGRLVTASAEQKERARKMGITDFNKKFTLSDMASGDVMFAATGVTDGSLLRGVHRRAKCVSTESIVMRASTGTIRRVSTEYRDLAHRGL
jgi:fructose-1,6-bisphosphatase II / sedoheptulose-1,7-bisphosphatase